MSKQNRKPGIHLHKTKILRRVKKKKGAASNLVISDEYYWILIACNGKTIARSSETYKRKGSAVASIRIATKLFAGTFGMLGGWFIDHTKSGAEFTNYYDHKLK